MISSAEATLVINVPQVVPIPAGSQFLSVRNDHASSSMTVTLGGAGATFTVKAGEELQLSLTPTSADSASLVSAAAVPFRLQITSGSQACAIVPSTASAGIVDGSVTTAKLADGVLSADATGRAKMAAGFFGLVAASVAHFVDGFFTQAVVAAKFAAGCIDHSKKKIVAPVILADADAMLTAAQLCDSSIFAIAPTAPRTLLTDTAANIILALPGQQIGTWFDFTIVSTAANTATLSAGIGVTIVGAVQVPANASGLFRCVVDGAASVRIVRIA